MGYFKNQSFIAYDFGRKPMKNAISGTTFT